MIHTINLHNFKAIRDASVHLERLTVLVGPNASGKTSVLEGLYYLAQLERKRGQKHDQSVEIPLRVMTAGQETMRLVGIGVRGRSFGMRFSPTAVEILGAAPVGLQVFDPIKCTSGDYIRLPVSDSPLNFSPAILLRFDTAKLVASSYSDKPVPEMGPDGEGLASVLAYMALNQPAEFATIIGSLRSVVPIVRTLRFPRARVVRNESEIISIDQNKHSFARQQEYWGNAIEFDMEGARGIPANMVSEGTLLVLGLLTVLMGPNRPRLLLLDDLDRALHPKAQEQVIGLLRTLLERQPELQIVATSHSPYLLDHLKPEEVRLTALTDDGYATVGRLDAHPLFEKWKEEMAPGEFWSMVGEKWLADAKAGEPHS